MAAGDDSSVALGAPTGNADTRLTASGDHRQVVAVGNAGDRVAGVDPRLSLNVNLGPNTWLSDGWAGSSVDTTNRWTQVGNAPTVSAGSMTMSATLSSYNYLKSQATMPYTLGYQYVAMGIQIEGASAGTGAGRFWGLGNQATTPAATVLAQDGVGFEIDQASGSLLAVTYAAGVRTTVATLTRPTDGAVHRYAIHVRPTEAIWYLDGLEIPVATASFPNVQIAELPLLIVRQNAGSLTNSPVFMNTATAAGDTSRMGDQIVDGTYPWRKAQVGKTGGLSVKGTTITSTTTGFAAAATGTAGPVDVSEAGNVTFTVYNTVAATAYTGTPVVVFEQSYDNISWGPLIVVRSDNQQAASTHVLSAGTANGAVMFDAPAEAINYVRARVTTGTTTNGMTIAIGAGGMPFIPSMTVIDRKDAARTNVSATYTSSAPVVADTLLTLALNKGSTASSVTTVPVSTGRVLRITAIMISLRATAATLPFGLATLRVNYSGAAVIGSTGVATVGVSGSAAVIGNTGTVIMSPEDGFVDLSGTAQWGLSFSNNVTTNVANITVVGYEYAA